MDQKPQTVAFILEAGPGIGLGHVDRSGVLARELQRRGHSVLAAVQGPRDVLPDRGWQALSHARQLQAETGEPTEAKVLDLASETNPQWICIDGYGFANDKFIRALKARGYRVLVFDDLDPNRLKGLADIVVNQNGSGGNEQSGLLNDTRYALVSANLLAGRNRPATSWQGRILVSLGGADPKNLTRPILRLLDQTLIPACDIDVIIGPYFEDKGPFESPRHRLHIHDAPETLTPFMLSADLIVTAAGSSCWQACAAAIPMVAIETADNQRVVTRTLADAKAAVVLRGDDLAHAQTVFKDSITRLVSDDTARHTLSQAAAALVDGQGAHRIADAMGL